MGRFDSAKILVSAFGDLCHDNSFIVWRGTDVLPAELILAGGHSGHCKMSALVFMVIW